MKRAVLLFIFSVSVSLCAVSARAAIPVNRTSGDLLNLDLSVYVAGKPVHFILIEKDFQRLRVLRHDGRLQVVAEYFAATGENFGPKQVEGDSKTPEGIYFIIKRFTDTKVTVFGTRAFHLNYPNIFDSSEGKGGNGIYIHGTNKELRSNSTNGCITLNNIDLDGLSSFLNVGTTPVIIVSSLQKLNTGKGVYPDLTRKNYLLAKELLAPHFQQEGGFVSLYLIRVNGQTVVAGDYREPVGSKHPNFVAAYLDVTQENGWYAVKTLPDLGPVANEAGQLAEQTEPLEGQEVVQQAAWGDIWKPHQEDMYLNWYRDSIKDDIDLTVAAAAPAEPATDQTDTRMVYGLFLLATCFSIGSALIFIRSQARRMKESCAFGSGVPLPPGLRADELIDSLRQVESLQGDIQRAKETLQMLQEYVHEETQGMDTQDLQARIDELESELAEKRGEIDQLATEKAALKLKGMAHLSGQVEELSSMRQELQRAQEQLAESRKDLGRLPVLEEMVSSQKSEIQQLFAEKASMKLQLSDSQDQQGVLERLRQKAETLEETLAAEAQRRKSVERQLGERDEERAAALAARQAEVSGLEEQIDALRQAADRSDIEGQLLEVRNELATAREAYNSEQQRSAELEQRLDRFSELEEALRQRETRIEQLAAEKASLEAQLDRSDVEAVLVAVKNDLTAARETLAAEQQRSAELQQRLGRFSELEEALRQREARIEQLAAEKASLEAQLDTRDVEEALVAVRTDLAASREALVEEQQRSAAMGKRLARFSEMEQELGWRSVQVERLIAEKASLQEQLNRSDLEEELAEVRRELAASQERVAFEQERNMKLDQQQERIAVLEGELELRAAELEEQSAARVLLQEQLEQSDQKEELAQVRTVLAESQQALQAEQEKNAQLQVKSARVSELEELLVARQVEVTSLTNEKKAMLARAEEERHQRIETLEEQLDSLRRELENERHERQRVQRLAQERMDAVRAMEGDIERLLKDLASAQHERQAEDDFHLAAPQPAPFAAATLVEEQAVAVVEEPVMQEALSRPVEPVEMPPQPVRETVAPPAPPQPQKKSASWVTGSNLLPDDVLQSWIKS